MIELKTIKAFRTTAEFHNHLKKLVLRQSFRQHALQQIVDQKVHLRRTYVPQPN